MRITITGKPKTGKTTIANTIKLMLESLGASVILTDLDEYKYIPSGSKPLSGQEIVIEVLNE